MSWIYRLTQPQTQQLYDALKKVDADFDTAKCRFLVAFDDKGEESVWVPFGMVSKRYAMPSGMPTTKLLKQEAINFNVYEVANGNGVNETYSTWCKPNRWWLAAPESVASKVLDYNIIGDEAP